MIRTSIMAAAIFLVGAGPLLAAPVTDAQTAGLAGSLAVHPEEAFRLKTQIGDDGLRQVSGEIYATRNRDDPCLYSEPRMLALAAIDMATRSDTEGAWKENRARAAAILGAFAATPLRPVRTSPEPPATDARSVEYAGRVALDQAWRARRKTLEDKSDWAKNLEGATWTYLNRVVVWKMCVTDRENTAWLKADLAARGWPRISTASAQADHDAWLLAQHADADRAFQIRVLEMMEPLVSLGETNPSKYALLRFRVFGPDGPTPKIDADGIDP